MKCGGGDGKAPYRTRGRDGVGGYGKGSGRYGAGIIDKGSGKAGYSRAYNKLFTLNDARELGSSLLQHFACEEKQERHLYEIQPKCRR